MITHYSDYSGLSINEIENDPNLQYLKPGFYSDRNIMISKYQLMSPQLLTLVMNSHYRSCLEYAGGIGVLSELIKETSPLMNVTYANVDCDEFRFTKWRINIFKNLSPSMSTVRLLELDSFKINDTYDIIISDGVVQNFNSDIQIEILKIILNKVIKIELHFFLFIYQEIIFIFLIFLKF